MLTVDLLPELDAAIAHLRGELAQLRAGELDEQLHALALAPPLPEPQFSALLRAWEAPPVPEVLVALARSLAPSEGGSTTTDASATVDLTACESDGDDAAAEVVVASTSAPGAASAGGNAETDAEVALTGLCALRRSMLLDVLSKIRSVAKSKGVDPAMFATRRAKDGGRADFLDLEAIAREVERGTIVEWELFAHQVYLFCQHVIADSEKHEQAAAKQKGVELLHFARTLTETLRKASAKKEDALLQEIASAQAARANVGGPEPSEPASAQHERVEELVEEHEGDDDPETDTSGKPTSASPSGRRQSADALTPNRVSARIRQRGSSFSSADAAAALNDDDDDGDDPETRAKKRPRAASSATVVTTASEDENASESESQLSAASEAESLKRRSSSSRAKEPSASAQTTPVTRTRTRTRQRRPVLPATRASSRQQKRRAASSARAAEDDEEKEASDATGNGDEDTAQDEDEEETNSDAAAAAAAAGATPPPPSVPLTKSGRPRKRPGRKPAGWKKSDTK